MQFLGKYDEFVPGYGFPSVREHMSEHPYSAKETVLQHLESGSIHMVTAATVRDAVTGEATNIPVVFRNDGKYSWNSKLIYHIQKYNLRLPEEVEEYFLSCPLQT